MAYRTTMTGSWFRPKEILGLLAQSPTGELPESQSSVYLEVERQTIQEQLHPLGNARGLYEVSNGQSRVTGYTSYLPSRFQGFSPSERVPMPMPPELIQEMMESNPAMAAVLPSLETSFSLPKIVAPLRYHGEANAAREARDAARLAQEEGAPSIFLPAPSPGVITIFYPNNTAVYPTHLDYLRALSRELAKEYRAILDVPGVVLQIDAPDLAMGRQTAGEWGKEFYEMLPHHVDAINEAIRGLPRERVRVHYCYGNYAASHESDADFARVLPELTRLRAASLVGELANPHHEGDLLILRRFAKEHGWPSHLGFVGGVIDVKTPIVESPETVKFRLDTLASIVGESNTWGGTDCGFETFAGMNGVTHPVALRKLRALAEGAARAG
jgi:5-methyltetrahydropteroyltriglutamate--homocysteine methyltransferase